MAPAQGIPSIRPARPEDLRALARITRERSGGDSGAHERSLLRFLAHAEATGRSLLLVAQIEGEIVAFGKCRYLVPPRRDPPDPAPEGWYLAGLIVDARFRRRGIGRALTQARLRWVSERADRTYYVANARNAASIALHAALGFAEVARGPAFATFTFEGGVGVLCRAVLAVPAGDGGPAPCPGGSV
jgi:ribosomal protein S18 acetylase RimI-like enzyme